MKKTAEVVDEDMVTIESITEEDDSVVKLLNSIILTAVNKKASDIHIEISDALIIKYRIDGILHQIMEPLDCTFHPFLLTRLKVMSELDIAEKRVPQADVSACSSSRRPSTSAFRSCPASTARTPSSASWTGDDHRASVNSG